MGKSHVFKWFLGSTAVLGTAAFVVVSNLGHDSNVIKSESESGNLTPNVTSEFDSELYEGNSDASDVKLFDNLLSNDLGVYGNVEFKLYGDGLFDNQVSLLKYVERDLMTEKIVSEVQPVLPEYVVSEKGTSEVQPSLPEFNEAKGTPEVQPVLPEYVVSEKGTPEVQPALPEYVVSEKGTPEVQPVLLEYVVSEKGTPEVQPALPEYVESKGTPEVQPTLPEYVVSEKGTPEVQPALPEYVVSEKGTPEVQPVLSEYVITHKERTEVTPILPPRVRMGDIRLNEGMTRISYPGKDGSLTTIYDDYIGINGEILKSDKISESRIEPIVKVVRFGLKKPNETIGESGMYRLSEHASDTDIVKFNQNITLTADEIKALGQDEITKRSELNIENNLWLVGKPGWYVISNAPLSDETISKLNTDYYVNHKNVGLEVLRLVNEERKRLGKTELKWSDGLYELSKVRATELGLNGHIRFWNDKDEEMKHVRDAKGTKWFDVAKGTAFESRGLGENLAGYTLPRNVYKVFSEKDIAKQLYDQWRESPGHYANMIYDNYTEFGFDMSYSVYWRNNRTSIDYFAQGIQGVQLFAV